MRPIIGDLAIVEFDTGLSSKDKWEQFVCIVFEFFKATNEKGKIAQCAEILYWAHHKGLFSVQIHSVELSRLIRVTPKDNKWNGSLRDLSIDDIVFP